MKYNFAIYRRDLLGSDCTICPIGVYISQTDDSQVYCPACGDEMPRWVTKREIMEHRMKGTK